MSTMGHDRALNPKSRVYHFWRNHRPMNAYCGAPVKSGWKTCEKTQIPSGYTLCQRCSERDDIHGFVYYHADGEAQA